MSKTLSLESIQAEHTKIGEMIDRFEAQATTQNEPLTAKVEKYRPSNDTEGDIFMDVWCRHCARDKAMREGLDVDECDDDQLCKIIALTMEYKTDDPEYPIEWQYKNGHPICMAFIQAGQPVPLKDDLTMDLF
jgi:hypothetical protein